MCVWIVVDNEGNIEGVFSSERKAQDYCFRYGRSWPRSIETYLIDACCDASERTSE